MDTSCTSEERRLASAVLCCFVEFYHVADVFSQQMLSPASINHLSVTTFCLVTVIKRTFPVQSLRCQLMERASIRQITATRGHPYKLLKPQCTSNVRSFFFTQRVINVWNDLPTNIVNFSSLVCFRRSLLNINFSDYLVVI